MVKKVLSVVSASISVYLLMVADFMFRMYREVNTSPSTGWFALLVTAFILSVAAVLLITSCIKEQAKEVRNYGVQSGIDT